METWHCNVKPSRSKFKDFHDEAYWFCEKEHIKTTLEAQNLSHLINPTYTPTNRDLDQAQMKWFYKVLQDVCVAPTARQLS